MQGFLITLAACSVTMSALALFYMAVTPLLAKRYSITGRYYAWLIIVLGLIIPFRPQSGNAVVKVHVPVNKPVPFIRTGTGAPMAVPVDNMPPLPAVHHRVADGSGSMAVGNDCFSGISCHPALPVFETGGTVE